MGFAFILYLIVLAIIFYIDYLIAKKCEQIAADKGYTDYKIFAWTFWLTPIGIAMTIALPDKKSQEYQKKMIELMEEAKGLTINSGGVVSKSEKTEISESERLANTYHDAVAVMNEAGQNKNENASSSAELYKEAAIKFESISGYKDSDLLSKKCFEESETCCKNDIYNSAVSMMNEADQKKNEILTTAIELYKEAADKFESITGFKDSDTLSKKCLEESEICRKDGIYNSALSMMNVTTVASLEEATKSFQSIPCWKDSDEQVLVCKNKIEEIKAKEEAERLQVKLEAEKAAKKRKKVIIITSIVVSIIIILTILLKIVVIPLINKNNFISKYGQKTYEMFGIVEEGSTIKFGSYEQDDDTYNGYEDIEWEVLSIEDGKALVISKYGLDAKAYNKVNKGITWETCSLRNWLNKTFYSQAFSSEEQSMIIDSTITADKNPNYNTNPGNDTTDKIFLFSITEVEEYFSSDIERVCTPTTYAAAKGVSEVWWLRSPGRSQYSAAYVNYDGSIGCTGYDIDYDNNCVRPVMWINLES